MLKQITTRKCTMHVISPDGSEHNCCFGDYETFMAVAEIDRHGNSLYFGQPQTLAVKIIVGYLLEDGTKLMFTSSPYALYGDADEKTNSLSGNNTETSN